MGPSRRSAGLCGSSSGRPIEVPREEEGFGWYSKLLQAIEAYIDAHGKTPVPIVFDLEPEITEVVGSPPLIARDQNTADAPVQLLFAAFSADLSASPTLASRLSPSQM